MLHTLLNGATLTDAVVETPSLSLFDRLKAVFARPEAVTPDSEIEAFIQSNGGVLTDQLEREISRRFGASAGG